MAQQSTFIPFDSPGQTSTFQPLYDEGQSQPKAEGGSNGFFTWPNAVRMAASTAGDYLAPFTGWTSPGLLGGAGEFAGQLMEGRSPDWGIIGTEALLNYVNPFGPNVPGTSTGLKAIGEGALRGLKSGTVQGALGTFPRHQAAQGNLLHPLDWEMPGLGEWAGQTAVGGVAGTATGGVLSGLHTAFGKKPPVPSSHGFDERLPLGGFTPIEGQLPLMPEGLPGVPPVGPTTPPAPSSAPRGQMDMPFAPEEMAQPDLGVPFYGAGTPLEKLPLKIRLQDPTQQKIALQNQRGYVEDTLNPDGSLTMIRKDQVPGYTPEPPEIPVSSTPAVPQAPQQAGGEMVLRDMSTENVARLVEEGWEFTGNRDPVTKLPMMRRREVIAPPEVQTPIQRLEDQVGGTPYDPNKPLEIPKDRLTNYLRNGWQFVKETPGGVLVRKFVKDTEATSPWQNNFTQWLIDKIRGNRAPTDDMSLMNPSPNSRGPDERINWQPGHTDVEGTRLIDETQAVQYNEPELRLRAAFDKIHNTGNPRLDAVLNRIRQLAPKLMRDITPDESSEFLELVNEAAIDPSLSPEVKAAIPDLIDLYQKAAATRPPSPELEAELANVKYEVEMARTGEQIRTSLANMTDPEAAMRAVLGFEEEAMRAEQAGKIRTAKFAMEMAKLAEDRYAQLRDASFAASVPTPEEPTPLRLFGEAGYAGGIANPDINPPVPLTRGQQPLPIGPIESLREGSMLAKIGDASEMTPEILPAPDWALPEQRPLGIEPFGGRGRPLTGRDPERGALNLDVFRNIGKGLKNVFDTSGEVREPSIAEQVEKTNPDGTWKKVQKTTGWGRGGVEPPKKTGKRGEERQPTTWEQMWALPNQATTTLDLSAPFRQGIGLIWSKEFWKALPKMIKAGLSQEEFNNIDAQIRAKEIFQPRVNMRTGGDLPSIAEEAGVKLIKDGADIGASEMGVAGNWIETGGNIPGFSKTYRATIGKYGTRPSNRAYATFLNHLRANRFEALMKQAEAASLSALTTGKARVGASGLVGISSKFNPQEAVDLNPFMNKMLAREIGDFINTATGRAPLKLHYLPYKGRELNLESSIGFLGKTLFAPKLLFSRMRMLDPFTYTQATPQVRLEYLRAAVGVGGAWLAVAQMAKMIGGDDVSVSNDITSADFGKIRVRDTRLDPAGGFQQFIVALARLAEGGTTTARTNRFTPFGQGFRAETAEDSLERFFVNKLNPLTKFGYDVFNASKTVPFQVGDRTAQLFVPLIAQDFWELYQKDPDLIKSIMPFVSVGMGTQTYGKGEAVSKFFSPKDDWTITGGGILPGLRNYVRGSNRP